MAWMARSTAGPLPRTVPACWMPSRAMLSASWMAPYQPRAVAVPHRRISPEWTSSHTLLSHFARTVVSRKKHVIRQVDLDAMALANGDRGQHVQVAVQDATGGGRETGAGALAIGIL